MPPSMPCMETGDKQQTPSWWTAPPASRQRHFHGGQQQDPWIIVEGQSLRNFSSNDYLGLRKHPDVLAAAIEALREHGLGAGASRYVCGDAPVFHRLEDELAKWKGAERCLLVGSGMLANIGLMQALCGRHTEVFADRWNHASLLDGIRLAGARLRRFAHRDIDDLERLLRRGKSRTRVIVSDGVFSMDGDEADVQALIACAERYDAWLVLDDAHGNGCLGEHGGGLSRMAGIQGHPRLIEVGTFGKAFGGYGAFILGSEAVIDGLRQRLRTAIYSTAMPPSMAAAMRISLRLIQRGKAQALLRNRIRCFREMLSSLPLLPSRTPIQPLILGTDEAALRASKALAKRGFFIPAIRPPTVPEGSARLRITISVMHDENALGELAHALPTCMAT